MKIIPEWAKKPGKSNIVAIISVVVIMLFFYLITVPLYMKVWAWILATAAILLHLWAYTGSRWGWFN